GGGPFGGGRGHQAGGAGRRPDGRGQGDRGRGRDRQGHREHGGGRREVYGPEARGGRPGRGPGGQDRVGPHEGRRRLLRLGGPGVLRQPVPVAYRRGALGGFARYAASAACSRSWKRTAIWSCSRYCSSVLPPNAILFEGKNSRTSRSHSALTSPVT